jgi:GR25 family glycosyltransferase involved in LPS biosynthesis
VTAAVPIYLINLARSAERLAHMEGQLGRQSLAFRRIEACDGRSMPDAELDEFRRLRPRREGWLPGGRSDVSKVISVHGR